MTAAALFDVRRLLNRPRAFLWLMRLIGADVGMRRIADQMLRAQPGQRVLDIGCGPGRLRGFLPKVSYVGIDNSAAYLAQARERYPEGRFAEVDLERDCSGFADGDFDLIVANALLHHLSDDAARRMFAFSRDRLRDGGRLVTLDCVQGAGQHPLARLLIAMDRGNFVRDAATYQSLARSAFASVQATLYDNLLRVPYAHIVLECRK